MTQLKIIAHGAAKGLAAENSLAGCEKAIAHHVDEVEIDVRVTKDGVTALIHEPFVSDPSGNKLLVAHHTFAELQQYVPSLTTLDAAIEIIDRHVPLLIEVKPGVPTEPVIAIVHQYLSRGWVSTDFTFGSYSQPVLLSLHKAFPEIETSIIEDWSSIRAIRRAKQIGTKRINMLEYWLWPGFINAMSRRGFELYSFPPKNARKEKIYAKFLLTGATNNPKRAQKWAKHGLAGVITDYPDRFKA